MHMMRVFPRRVLLLCVAAIVALTCLTLTARRQPERADAIINKVRIATTLTKLPGQQGCKLPVLNINDPEVAPFYTKPYTKLDCEKKNGHDMLKLTRDGQIDVINDKIKRSSLKCTVAYIHRITDHKYKYSDEAPVTLPFTPQDEFPRVTCKHSASWRSRAQFFLAAGSSNASPNTTATERRGPSVYWLGLDSLSQMAFRRTLPRTVAYLEETMGSVVLDGMNIVGDGTPQAFIPMLTGQTEVELPLTRKRYDTASYVDVYPWVWNNFSAAGYLTAYNEDNYSIGIFNYRLRGFSSRQPTHHYSQTAFHAFEDHFRGWPDCIGATPQHKMWLRYTGDILRRQTADRPVFAVSHHGVLSHDDITKVKQADDDLTAHLRELNEAKQFENTIVIVMSDHGNRFQEVRNTAQGQLEERLPFFSIFIPPKYRDDATYKRVYENVKANAARLVTPFDIHATMLDILNWSQLADADLSTPQQSGTRSLSLFRPIAEHRSCEQAGIEPHWCTCLAWETLATDSKAAMQVANAIVSGLSSQSDAVREQCFPLRLDKVISARVLKPNDGVLNYAGAKDADGFVARLKDSDPGRLVTGHYQIKLRTQPAGAIYEVTVFADAGSSELQLDPSAVSRLNAYGSQGDCMRKTNAFLVPVCVCRDWEQ